MDDKKPKMVKTTLRSFLAMGAAQSINNGTVGTKKKTTNKSQATLLSFFSERKNKTPLSLQHHTVGGTTFLALQVLIRKVFQES